MCKRRLRVKELREAADMTQKELAQRMRVLQPAVCKWENGSQMPPAGRLPDLAELFGVTLDELFERALTAPQPTEAAS